MVREEDLRVQNGNYSIIFSTVAVKALTNSKIKISFRSIGEASLNGNSLFDSQVLPLYPN